MSVDQIVREPVPGAGPSEEQEAFDWHQRLEALRRKGEPTLERLKQLAIDEKQGHMIRFQALEFFDELEGDRAAPFEFELVKSGKGSLYLLESHHYPPATDFLIDRAVEPRWHSVWDSLGSLTAEDVRQKGEHIRAVLPNANDDELQDFARLMAKSSSLADAAALDRELKRRNTSKRKLSQDCRAEIERSIRTIQVRAGKESKRSSQERLNVR